MTENNINTLDPETQVIVMEQTIKSMEKLISKREIWLNDSKNKGRSLYNAVAADTKEMKEKLIDYTERMKKTELKTK